MKDVITAIVGRKRVFAVDNPQFGAVLKRMRLLIIFFTVMERTKGTETIN